MQTIPRITFTHAGRERTLNKHISVVNGLKLNTLTLVEAKLKPWYLRVTLDGRERSFPLASGNADAIRGAKSVLDGAATAPKSFADWQAFDERRKGRTIGVLASEWLDLGCPFGPGKPRAEAAATTMKATVGRAMSYWSGIVVATVTPQHHSNFAAQRGDNKTSGQRSADLELGALSSLCQWGMRVGHIVSNPFAVRETFATEITHCHESCPDDDETLHRLLEWIYEREPVAAGWLTWCALTGQRPGEPVGLLAVPALDARPSALSLVPPGTEFPDGAGGRRIKIMRLKHGQNPFVFVHPALADFLGAWRGYHARALADEERLFPGSVRLDRVLSRACAALGISKIKAHGMRAYYVRVRRSQGATDEVIASELGQTTNGALIRSVYGNPDDMVGGKLFDWLPENSPPAWDILKTISCSKPLKTLDETQPAKLV